MIGWNISVFRQTDGGASPAKKASREGRRLATWQADVGGLGWLEALVAEGVATDLGGNGYPYRYTARAERVVPRILAGPPDARARWQHDSSDIITPAWAGKTQVDRLACEDCAPAEWLLIVAWDES